MVEIRGDIGSLQSSIDFYLGITSKSEIKDSRFMRDRFFNVFQEEDSYRKENFLDYQIIVSSNYKIDKNAEPELVGEEVEFEEGFSYFSNVSETEKEIDNLENEKANSLNDSKYLETECDFEEDDNEDFEDEFIWGGSDEYDLDEEDADEINNEEDVFGYWGSSDDYEEDEDGNDISDNWGSNEDDYLKDEDSEDDIFNNWNIQDEDDSQKDLKSLECVEEVKNTVISNVTSQKNDDITTIPSDLRDFIKMYPNCDISVVYKYFSRKEVDKQLKLGRVFKRKNKLCI